MINYSNIVYDYIKRNRKLPYIYTFEYKSSIFIGLNTVFSPIIFEDSFWFGENLPFKKNDKFLEIGCGTGFISIIAAQKGCTKVLSTDINPDAIKNTQLNSLLFGFEKIISTQVSNVFREIKLTPLNKYSLIFWNSPFIYTEKEDLDNLENSVFSYRYQAINEYIKNVQFYLEPNGRCFLGFSSSSGDIEFIKAICRRHDSSLTLFSHYVFEDNFRIDLFEIKFHN